MYYSLLIYGSEGVIDRLDETINAQVLEQHRALQRQLATRGAIGPIARLMPTSTAVTLRAEGEDVMVLDGPYAETKEQFLGFYLVWCDSIAEAVEIAKKLPVGMGAVEVRPISWVGGMGFTETDR
jgi:hypothetical protein